VVAAAGVGLVGVGVGSFFGISSKNNHDDAEAYCDDQDCTSERGVELKEDAIRNGNMSTVAFAIGGVGLATAGVLLLALPSGNERGAHAAIVVGPTTLGMRGSF
jgi:serine/threonine-protein kinase